MMPVAVLTTGRGHAMTLAPLDPIDRAWWHLHLSPDLLYADMREQPACRAEPLEFDDEDDEDYDYDYDKDRACRYCEGDGGDPWNDYCTECPECLGTGVWW